MNNKFTMIILFVLGSFFVSKTNAQTVVKGIITDVNTGETLPGATVKIVGTLIGVSTDFNGKYTISIPSSNTKLLFSFIGYQPQEINVDGRTIINAQLVYSSSSLGEVVVTALGITRQKKALGYSVGQVKAEEFSRVSQENILNAIAGKVPGVAIASTGGTGSSVSMVIRGAKSLNNDNQPLFIVDGVPIANTLNNVSQIGNDNRVDYGNAIADINPDDIENVSILKGPSAAALYGSRAGNGVVVITQTSKTYA